MWNTFDKLFEIINPIFVNIFSTVISKNGYSALFKAGIVLLGISMISMSHVGPFLYDKDLSAHKAMFSIESAAKKTIEFN